MRLAALYLEEAVLSLGAAGASRRYIGASCQLESTYVDCTRLSIYSLLPSVRRDRNQKATGTSSYIEHSRAEREERRDGRLCVLVSLNFFWGTYQVRTTSWRTTRDFTFLPRQLIWFSSPSLRTLSLDKTLGIPRGSTGGGGGRVVLVYVVTVDYLTREERLIRYSHRPTYTHQYYNTYYAIICDYFFKKNNNK
jgi:hypothetical protein